MIESKVELHLGDCAKVMRGFPDACIDLTVTSPPYDNLRAYNGYVFDFEAIAQQLYRVTKPGGVVVWVVGDATIDGSETGTSFRQALYFMGLGFNLHDTMIWYRRTIPQNSNRYDQAFEYNFVFSKFKLNTFNPIKVKREFEDKRKIKEGQRKKSGERVFRKNNTSEFVLGINVWDIPTGGGISAKEDYVYNHPAIFPEELAKNHILTWSNPGDTILDPMTGSGTTGKMAVKYGRNFIGIEISEEYLAIAQKRIHDAQQQMRLL